MLLDMVESSRAENPGNSQRIHIGHLMFVHPDDIPRFKELNVIAGFSPAFWFPLPVNDILPEYMGEERASQIMLVAEMQRAGATIAIGSDWPAGAPTADPFRGLEALVTRMNPWDEYPGTPGEPDSLEDAIAMMTLNVTMAMNQEGQIGSIEVGKFADMIVLDQNLFEIEPEDISETNMVKTVFNGEVVYEMGRDPGPKTRR